MASKRLDLLLPPSESTIRRSPSKILHPEFSENPVIRKRLPSDTKDSTSKSYKHADDNLASPDLNSSSAQLSTQHSLHFKKSFFTSAQKSSVPSTSFLLSQNLNYMQEQNLSLRVEVKLKHLHHTEGIERRSEMLWTEPITDTRRQMNFNSMTESRLDTSLVMEGANDIQIPHLRWCAACKAEVTTRVVYVNDSTTFWSAVGIFLTGGVFGCFLLPYMTNTCKGVSVICNNCERVLL